MKDSVEGYKTSDTQLQKGVGIFKVKADAATDFIDGVPFESLLLLPQQERNRVARALLELTVLELFEWNFMQTDPNWGNYLHDPDSRRVVLLDFGACREFDRGFCDEYFDIVWSASVADTATLLRSSQRPGFLTGEESETMRAAHVRAGRKKLTVARRPAFGPARAHGRPVPVAISFLLRSTDEAASC